MIFKSRIKLFKLSVKIDLHKLLYGIVKIQIIKNK